MIVKAVISTWVDSTEPTDAIQITPHYRLTDGAEPAATTFANALLDAWTAYLPVTYRTAQRRVSIYNAQAPAPNYPITEVTRDKDSVKVSSTNRETALCLSYYASFNRPRYRGRLYVPCMFTGLTPSGASADVTIRAKVLALGTALAGVTPSTADWVVYSRVLNAATNVTNVWVDDSWDTVRSRNKRSTARTEGTITQ